MTLMTIAKYFHWGPPVFPLGSFKFPKLAKADLAVYPKFQKKQKVPWENGYCEPNIIDSQKRLRSELKDGHT